MFRAYKIIHILFWTILAFAAVLSVGKGFINGLRLVDFQWVPVKILSLGIEPYHYTLERIPFEGWQVDANQIPSCLALLWPFAWFSRETANTIWDVCNLLFASGVFFLIWKLWFEQKMSKAAFWFVVAITLCGTPFRVLIGNGQHLLFSMFFFLAAFFASQRGRPLLAGVLLALSLFKYTTIAPMYLVFVSLRQWRTIAVCAAIHIVATCAIGLWLDASPIVLIVDSLKCGSLLTAAGDADFASLAAKYGMGDCKLVALIGYIAYGILCLGLSLRKGDDPFLLLVLLALISNVMFYHRVYDFITLLFVLVLVVENWSDVGLLSWLGRVFSLLTVFYTYFVFRYPDVAWGLEINIVLEHLLIAGLTVRLLKGARRG